MTDPGKLTRSDAVWLLAQRVWAFVIGAGFVVVGVLRFFALEQVAGWETPEPVHGMLHLATGAPWLAAAILRRGRHAGAANRWLGAFWLAVGIAGNTGWLERVEALSFDDNAVHLVVGIGGVVLGWASVLAAAIASHRRRVTDPTDPTRPTRP